MLYVVIILSFLLIIGLFVIFNLLNKVEKQENMLLKQDQYISSISQLIDESNESLNHPIIREAFNVDDEVGTFFRNMVKIQEQMNLFSLYKNTEN